MVKIDGVTIKEGQRIIIPETWNERIRKYGRCKRAPKELEITKIIKEKYEKSCYYLCVSEKRKAKMIFSEAVVKYLCGLETDDLNTGLSFENYFPPEGTIILVTKSHVKPAVFELVSELLEIDGSYYVGFDFKLNFFCEEKPLALSIASYYDGIIRATWKFMFNEDVSYMNQNERTLRDTMIYKTYIEAENLQGQLMK